VERWEANHSVPARQQIAAQVTPAAGASWVASRVTAAGPITKQTSSAIDSTENAVCSRGDPASSADQRARAIGPSCGIVEPPATPAANSVQSGPCHCTAATSPATESAKITQIGTSTRCWPSRSVSRPNCGAQAALPSAAAADTVPASA
jgi:predicted PhzF superfamily epimerase YddE/YHI9